MCRGAGLVTVTPWLRVTGRFKIYRPTASQGVYEHPRRPSLLLTPYLTNKVVPIWSLRTASSVWLGWLDVFAAVFAEFRWWKDKNMLRRNQESLFLYERVCVCGWVCFACQTDYALSIWLRRGHSIIQQICNNLKLFARRWFSTVTLKELCSEWRRFMNIGDDCDSLTRGTKAIRFV